MLSFWLRFYNTLLVTTIDSTVLNSTFKITEISWSIFFPKSTRGKKGGWMPDECDHCVAEDPEVQRPSRTLPFRQRVATLGLRPHVFRLLLLPRYQRAVLSVKFHRCGH